MNRLYLLDVGSLGAWCHYAVSDHSDHRNLADGVRNWWKSFASRYQPTDAVACMDCSRESNWRKILSPTYKSGRDAKPKDEVLAEGMRRLPELFAELGVPHLRVDGFEADDIIATLSECESEVIIISTDGDMHQLVSDRVQAYDPRPNPEGICKFYDVDAVIAKHFVEPHRIRELKAIAGDTADSITGVNGLGKVFAVHAIRQTKSRAELVRRACAGDLEHVTKRQMKLFADNLEDFENSYILAGLRFDVPIPGGFSTETK